MPIYNGCSQEPEEGRSQAQGRCELHIETLSQREMKREEEKKESQTLNNLLELNFSSRREAFAESPGSP